MAAKKTTPKVISTKGLRLPPQSLDAEKALLGSVLLRPDVMHDLSDTISTDSFYADKHARIYDVMLELFGKGDPIDLLTVSQRLKERELLEQAGGMTYLTDLANTVPSSANVLHYSDIVQKRYMMRRLIESANYIAQIAYDESQDLDELMDKAEKQIFNLTNMPGRQTFTEMGSALGVAYEQIEKNSTEDALPGVPSGFTGLDNLLSGFQKSDLIILAARPSMGKTAFALNLARNAAIDHDASICIFSLEMSDQQLVNRMLSTESKISTKLLKDGLRTDEQFAQLREALGTLSNAKIFIDDKPGNDILKMRSVARRIKAEKGLDMIIVDYLQLMMLPGGTNRDSMVQQVTEISRSLKNLARELDVPVIALSQLSRAVEQRGGHPRLSDLRDSGSIEQDADIVMFIHREDKLNPDSERKNIADILVEKHRNGPVGRVQLYFKDEWVQFQNIDTQHVSMADYENF